MKPRQTGSTKTLADFSSTRTAWAREVCGGRPLPPPGGAVCPDAGATAMIVARTSAPAVRSPIHGNTRFASAQSLAGVFHRSPSLEECHALLPRLEVDASGLHQA